MRKKTSIDSGYSEVLPSVPFDLPIPPSALATGADHGLFTPGVSSRSSIPFESGYDGGSVSTTRSHASGGNSRTSVSQTGKTFNLEELVDQMRTQKKAAQTATPSSTSTRQSTHSVPGTAPTPLRPATSQRTGVNGQNSSGGSTMPTKLFVTNNVVQRPRRPGVTAPTPRSSKRKWFLLSLIPFAFFLLLIVLVSGYLILQWGWNQHQLDREGRINDHTDTIDQFLTTQEEWITVNDLVVDLDRLPMTVKQGETEMIGLTLAIKHSNVPGRERLVPKMEELAEVCSSISTHANTWNVLAGSSIDRVQNMNYHALRALQGVQKSKTWPVIPAPAQNQSGIIAQIQSAAHDITSFLAHPQEQRLARLHEAVSHEADLIAEELGKLRVGAIELVGELGKAANLVKNIADIASSEALLADNDRDELSNSFWQWFGVYSRSIAKLNTQIEQLEGMAGDLMTGYKIMSQAATIVTGLEAGFKCLEIALKSTTFEKSEHLANQLDRIQSSIDRLNAARQSHRAGVRARGYHQVRAEIDAF